MSRHALAALFLLGCTLPACSPDSEDNAPVSQEQFITIRNDYQRHNPDARVGMVTAVLRSAHLASVGSVAVQDFALGDVVSFIDADGNVIATGQVEAINNNLLDVRYKTSADGDDPVKGDLAVRAIK
jgi:hypothetical protein